MLIRFTTLLRDSTSGRSQGVFQAAFDLLDSDALDEAERLILRGSLDWFKANLPAPKWVDPRAIFWFKAHCGEPVRRVWQIVNLLKEHGVPVRMYRTPRPGRIIYSDQYQAAAIPGKRTTSK